MGAWGHKPFENDAALDFLGDLKRARKGNRVKRLAGAFQSYLDLAERSAHGQEMPDIPAADIRRILEMVQSQGKPPDGIDRLAPLLSKSDAELKAHVGHVIGTGNEEALVAVAAAWLVLDRLGADVEDDVQVDADSAPLAHIPLDSLRQILADVPLDAMRDLTELGASCLTAVLSNKTLCDSWSSGPLWEQQVSSYRRLLSERATAQPSSGGSEKA